MMKVPEIQSRVSVTSGVSVTIWSSATASRWHLMYGWLAWANVSAGGTIELREVGNATDSSVSSSFMRFMVPATGGFVPFDYDYPGVRASATGSSFRLNLDSGGTVTAMFVGFRSGHDA